MGIESVTQRIHANVETIIPGHGEICGRDEIRRFIDYMRALHSLTSESIEKGMTCDAVVKRVADEMFGYFETEPERLEAARMMFDMGTRRLYQEIRGRVGE